VGSVQWGMNTATATKFTITVLGHTYIARDASGTIVAVATFAPPRRPADGVTVMRERAEWLRRFV